MDVSSMIGNLRTVSVERDKKRSLGWSSSVDLSPRAEEVNEHQAHNPFSKAV